MRWCPYCKRMVKPTKYPNWGWFIFWLFVGVGIGALLNLLWAAIFKRQVPHLQGQPLPWGRTGRTGLHNRDCDEVMFFA